MKDLDKRLQGMQKQTPRRALRKDFVQTVLEDINQREALSEHKESLFMKLWKKPAFAALTLAVVLATGATTYAAVANWPAVKSFFGAEHMLDSGARIVEVKTEGCDLDSDGKTSDAAYYEIRKDSHFTNEEAVSMIQGHCEMQQINNKIGTLSKEMLPTAKGSIFSLTYPQLPIISIDSSSLTTEHATINAKADDAKPEKKVYALAPDVRVFDGNTPIQLSDLQAGDSIAIIVEDERNISTETADYVEDLSKMKIKAIVKVPPLTGDPSLFYQHIGEDFVRVEPKVDGSGFVRVYEFH